jgi:hypothetical protein
MNDDRELEQALGDLAEPNAPSTMTATVMARIARESEAAVVAKVPRRRELPSWILTVVGLLAMIGAFGIGWASTGAPSPLTPKLGGGLSLPFGGPALVVLAAGLMVYLAGLFAPLRARR